MTFLTTSAIVHLRESAMATSSNVSNVTDIVHGHGDAPSASSIPNLIELILCSLTIALATGYITLILRRPTIRKNKLNWFTINICIATVLFCSIMLLNSFLDLLGAPSSSYCRVRGFFLTMPITQLMYSHCVAAFSRLLTIVYATKRLFRSNACLWTCIGCGWLVALLANVPYLFIDGLFCLSPTVPTFVSYYALVTILLLPITIVTACNWRIFVFVRKSSRQVHAGGSGSRVSNARDVQILKILVGTFITSVIGWIPVFVTATFARSARIPFIVSNCFQILPSLTMFHDVIILIYTNQPVRVFLEQAILKRCSRATSLNGASRSMKTTRGN